jgi:hypothetical protein
MMSEMDITFSFLGQGEGTVLAGAIDAPRARTGRDVQRGDRELRSCVTADPTQARLA